MIIIDASAAVKLVLVEHDSEAVRDWFRTVEDDLAAPDMLAVEVAQAVVRRVNARQTPLRIGRDTLREWREFLEGDGIALVRSYPTQIDMAAQLAMELGHPVKDCVYLALALELGCALATCDAKFRDKAAPFYAQVRLLDEFS